MDERAVIAMLARAFEGGSDALVGIGDDAAVLPPSAAPILLSVDASIEGVHFERRFVPLDVVAERALTAALSDLAAMAAEPRAALLSLTLAAAEPGEVAALAAGFARTSRRHGCPIVGGNLSRGPGLSIHTTVLGVEVGPRLSRSGAREGDELWVSGTVGGAALGLAALMAERHEPELLPFVDRWRAPPARFDVARVVRGIATSGLDVSDGLARDAPRLAEASGVALSIELEALPRMSGHDRAAAMLGLDPLTTAWRGGEDYELLFSAPAAMRSVLAPHATRIGEVTRGSGVRTLRDGHEKRVPGGFDHFG